MGSQKRQLQRRKQIVKSKNMWRNNLPVGRTHGKATPLELQHCRTAADMMTAPASDNIRVKKLDINEM